MLERVQPPPAGPGSSRSSQPECGSFGSSSSSTARRVVRHLRVRPPHLAKLQAHLRELPDHPEELR